MPISKKSDGWYWGSKGPFNSRKKAEEVSQAAHASGYEKFIDFMKEGDGGGGGEQGGDGQDEAAGGGGAAAGRPRREEGRDGEEEGEAERRGGLGRGSEGHNHCRS